MGLLDAFAALVRAGYPEETARKIASGELPMDTASRMARAADQGYDPSKAVYHGTSTDFLDFIESPDGSLGPGVYLTPEASLASSYANEFITDDVVSGAQVMPLLVRGESIPFKDLLRQNPDAVMSDLYEIGDNYRRSGITSTTDRVRQVAGGAPQEVQAVFDPRDIRSYFSAAFDPDYTGPNILGGAALPVVGGLLAAGQSEDADAGFVARGGKTLLEAWHGSPHKFDSFSMDQIGTGEGAQAYGHGLYFADEIDVAKQYRDSIVNHRPPNMRVDGKGYGDMSGAEYRASAAIESEFRSDPMIDIDTAYERALRDLEYQKSMANKPELYDEDIDALKNLKGRVELDKGHLYRTEIDVTPESLLDWDKPLSEQSDYVKEALKKIPQGEVEITPNLKGREGSYWVKGNNWRGGKVNRIASSLEQAERVAAKARAIDLNSQGDLRAGALIDNADYEQREALSNTLREAGIPGIKYLDGDSRAVGDGTSNYVIFDDSLINIAERGAADPRLLGGTALGSAGILGAIAAGDRDDTAMAVAPRSDTLQDITMGLRGVERRLKGSPASLLFPEGVVNYLETVNRPYEDPTALTRVMALLDFL